MIVIPENGNESAETARGRLLAALHEEDTIYLIFRSDAQNESQVKEIAARADRYAEHYGNGMNGVIFIQDQNLLKEIVVEYFGVDKSIIAVSLLSGNEGGCKIAGKYALSEINDNIKIGKAFSNAI
jgi:uncharacterized protein (DUF1015 family)